MMRVQELAAAYEKTFFESDTPIGHIVLKIGEPNASLRRLYDQLGVRSAAYVTAWNPGSCPRSAAENNRAHEQLLQVITTGGYSFFLGQGRDPTGHWPPEDSVLVLGMQEEVARSLGQRFGQVAIVTVDHTATPRLLWLTTESAERSPDEPGRASP
jgi:hypothetical protein